MKKWKIMSTEERDTAASLDEFRDDAFFEASFNYWFDDEGERASPFPPSIRDSLKVMARDRFLEWLNELERKMEEDDMSNEAEDQGYDKQAIVEQFEEILFSHAMKMVETEEERITLTYPFMPRPGEKVEEQEGGKASTILSRQIVQDGDEKYMELTCEREDGSRWTTNFELPG